MPGRSVTSVSGCPLMAPLLRSTVTPGKLPTCWLEPVSWLNRVVLPQFWLPASAKVRVLSSGRGCSPPWCGTCRPHQDPGAPPFSRPPGVHRRGLFGGGHGDLCRVVQTQGQLIAVDAQLHRVAHGRQLYQRDLCLRGSDPYPENVAAVRLHRPQHPLWRFCRSVTLLTSYPLPSFICTVLVC